MTKQCMLTSWLITLNSRNTTVNCANMAMKVKYPSNLTRKQQLLTTEPMKTRTESEAKWWKIDGKRNTSDIEKGTMQQEEKRTKPGQPYPHNITMETPHQHASALNKVSHLSKLVRFARVANAFQANPLIHVQKTISIICPPVFGSLAPMSVSEGCLETKTPPISPNSWFT